LLKLLALASVLFALSLPYTDAPLAGDRMESLTVAGVKRTYVLHVPPGIKGPVPLVLAFHGHFGTGADFSHLTGFDALADRYGFIVAYPNGIKRGWDDGRALDKGHNDVGMVDALIAALSRRYPIDRKRIYATGFSNGGTFTQYLACTRSTVIAAIAPDAGPLPDVTGSNCRPKRAVSVFEMAGTTDPLVPYNGGEIRMAGFSRGTVWSAPRTVAFRAKNAHCRQHVSVALPRLVPSDGTSVTRTTYRACDPGTNVVLISITGGGHTWPGGAQYLPKSIVGVASNQFDASKAVVAFFLAHPMR
jgi:polyhydroxybutyrate depolymerase